jgi:hypothetical protein
LKKKKLPAANTLRHLLLQQGKHPQMLSSHKNIREENKDQIICKEIS